MKGAIGLQFNWIFVLIIGVMIFGIFIVQTETNSKQAKFEASLTIRESLQGMLTAPSDNYNKPISVPRITILNECDGNESTLFLGDARLPIHTTYFGLHAPERMTSKTLRLQVKDGITMLSSDNNVYVFVNRNTPELLQFYEAFEGNKKEINQNQESSNPPADTKLDYTMIYYIPNFGGPGSTDLIASNPFFPDTKKYNIAVISPDADGGWVHLFSNQDILRAPFVTIKIPYNTVGQVLGTIVDGDGELSECIRNQELRKLKTQLELFELRARFLANHDDLERCSVLLGTGALWLRDIGIDLEDFGLNQHEMYQDLRGIDRLNADLLRNNCPVIR